MIYFDNAATGGFKPRAVSDTAYTVIRYLSANPGRSGHRLSITGASTVYDCRRALAQTFNGVTEKTIFTKNCTEALNLAILGTAKKGGKVITTVFEHNSVLRPLYHLQRQGIISLSVVAPNDKGELLEQIQKAYTKEVYAVVVTATSNVTGQNLPLQEIGNFCKDNDLLFIVDGAQGGGHIPLDMQELNINALALAGHKGLMGIMGTGVLMLDQKTDVSPLIFGGTGTESKLTFQPDCYPEKLESGTLNLPAIAALNEGIRTVSENYPSFSKHLINYTKTLIEGLKKIDKIKVFSSPNPCGIVSFEVSDIPSNEFADILNKDYDIAVRGGLHCAPLMHAYLGTQENGLVRASLAVQNTQNEIGYFINSVSKIVNG